MIGHWPSLGPDANQPNRVLHAGRTTGVAAADARDTFFNGKLYVSNQDDAFSTVLVTHLAGFHAGEDLRLCECPDSEREHGRADHPATRSDVDDSAECPGGATDDPRTYYFQNYFKVVDRDGEKQVDAHDGPYVCDGTVVYPTLASRGATAVSLWT